MSTSNQSRARILQRLRNNAFAYQVESTRNNLQPDWTPEEKIRQFTDKITAVKGEVIQVKRDNWQTTLSEQFSRKNLKRILVGDNALGEQIRRDNPQRDIRLYEQSIENFKDSLFHQIDASVSGCRCAIAETGSLVLWPDAAEPRLLSLVPPVHIVILESQQLFNSFAEVVEKQQWQNGMPANALLISGPSKTADIEQTLAYGIHGPKQLLVLILSD